METFTSEINMRLSQEMDSMMSMMHSQIIRAISTAIAERVIPEIHKIVSSRSSPGNRDTEASSSPNSEKIIKGNNGFKSKTTKKDSRSACDLRTSRDSSPYIVTGANHTQRQIPDFLTGRIHSNLNLERQDSNHNVSLDLTLPATELEVPKTPHDLLIRLADVLVNLHYKPQS